jgi:hypothetical protein
MSDVFEVRVRVRVRVEVRVLSRCLWQCYVGLRLFFEFKELSSFGFLSTSAALSNASSMV